MQTAHTLKANDPNQAAAYVGATVQFDQEHEDHEEDMVGRSLGDTEGTVIDSVMIQGIFAVTVKFETEMFCGIVQAPADRFTLKMDA